MILAPMFPSNDDRFSCDEEKLVLTNTYPEPYTESSRQMVNTMGPRVPTERSSSLYTPPDSPVVHRSSLKYNNLSSKMAFIEQQVCLNAIAAATSLSNAAPTDWLSSQLDGSDEQHMSCNSKLHLPQLWQYQQQQQSVAGVPLLPGRSRPSKKYHLTESDIRPMDVLCGRGGKSNNHPGNKHYRQVVGDMREKYRVLTGKKQKTGLGYSIVDYIESQGGRFLKRNGENMYTVLNKAEARRKTSQALRETKELKWTLEK